jgi:hypothetical protein
MFKPMTEYKGGLLWAITGLALAAIGNLAGVIIFSPRNIFRTIIGALIGLVVGIGFSLYPHPIFCFIGIVTIFIGALIGHHKSGE